MTDHQFGGLTVQHDTGSVIPVQAETDGKLVAMWLHGRSAGTMRAYRADAAQFMACAAERTRKAA